MSLVPDVGRGANDTGEASLHQLGIYQYERIQVEHVAHQAAGIGLRYVLFQVNGLARHEGLVGLLCLSSVHTGASMSR